MAQGYLGTSPYKTLTGLGAPVIIPQFIGQQYIDVSSGNIYVAVGVTGSYNWGFIGRGLLQSFLNDTVPGLLLRIDASDETSFTKDGSGIVSQWNDLSGNSRHFTQGTLANRPIWAPNYKGSLPMVIFDGSNDFMQSPSITQIQPFTVFAIGKFITLSSNKYFIGANNADSIRSDSTSSKWACYFGSDTSGLSLGTNYYIFTLTVNGSSTIQTLNGTTSATINPSTNGLTSPVSIGSNNAGSSNANIALGEFLLYSGSLSAAQKLTIETYLKNKWSIF